MRFLALLLPNTSKCLGLLVFLQGCTSGQNSRCANSEARQRHAPACGRPEGAIETMQKTQTGFFTHQHRRYERSLLWLGTSALAILATPVLSQTVNVINTNDAGVGSLRAAIESANADPAILTVRGVVPLDSIITLNSGPIDIASTIILDGENAYTISNIPDLPNRSALHISGGNTLTIAAPVTVSTQFDEAPAPIIDIGGIRILDDGNRLDIYGKVETRQGRQEAIVNIGDGNEIRVRAGGSVSSTGVYTGGIQSSGAAASIVLEAGSDLTARSFSSRGIAFSGAGTIVDIAGHVGTTGQASIGVAADLGAENSTINVSGRISTEYSGLATGILVSAGNNVVTVSETGEISTQDHEWSRAISFGTNANNGSVIIAGKISVGAGRAIEFGGADNRLELQAGYSITGSVSGTGSDQLVFGGIGNASFDLAGLGTQYTGFDTLQKNGNSTWTLTGDGSTFASTTTVNAGTLLVGDAAGNGVLGGQIIVKSGATLGGSGHIGINPLRTGDNSIVYNVIETGGILAPGNGGMGELTLTGGWRFEAGSQLHFQIGTPGSAETPGTSDRIVVGDGNRTHLVLSEKPELHLFDAGGAGIGHYRLITLNHAAVTYGQGGNFTIMQPGPIPGADYRVAEVWEPGHTNSHFDLIIGNPDNLQYWQDNSANWTAAGLDWRNSGGAVDVAWAGNHGVFEGNGGTIAVQGNQSFKGLQFVTSDYTLAGPGTLQTVAGGSELRVLGDRATIGAEITGAGGIFKTQAGQLILTGANSYTGATVIERGTLRLQGAGSIASSEALHISSSGWLDAISVSSGSISLGSLLSDGIILLGNNDLRVTQAVAGHVDYISGNGDFTLAGPGVLTVTGIMNMPRATIESGATLRIGNGTGGGQVTGDIHNVGTLIIDRSDTTFDDGTYTGNGAFFHRGTGTTILNADSRNYSGAVGVENGTLRLTENAVLGTSLLTVGANGTLRGLGEIRGDVAVAGRLAPGAFTPPTVPGGDNRLGTLTVLGDVAFGPGASFDVRIASDGTHDALRATTASLGGEVAVSAIDAQTSYVDGQTYTILTTTDVNGISGAFDGGARMLTHSAFLTPTLTHNADNVVLNIAVTADFTTVAETYNQRQVASALNGLGQTGDALAVFNAIASMNAGDARRAFDLSSGEVHASGQHMIDQTFALFGRTLRQQGGVHAGAGNSGAEAFTAPLAYGPVASRGNAGVAAIDGLTHHGNGAANRAWAAPLGGFGRIDADGNAARLDWWHAGLAGGYEGVVDLGAGHAVAGLGLGYIRSRGAIDSRLSSFDSDGFYAGAYGSWTDGPWALGGSLAYGANHVSTERQIPFMGRTAAANYWTHTIGLSGEASYAFELTDATRIAPLFTLDAGWSGHGGFTETGAGALNLASAAESWGRLDAGIGLALSHTVLTETGSVTFEGRAVWEHAFADVVPSQALTLAGSPAGFNVLGPNAGRDRLRIGGGVSWALSDDMTLRARYDGLFSKGHADHATSVGLNVRF